MYCIVRLGAHSLGRFGPREHLAPAMLSVDVAQRERRSKVVAAVDSVGPWRDQSMLDTSGTLAHIASVGPDAPRTCVALFTRARQTVGVRPGRSDIITQNVKGSGGSLTLSKGLACQVREYMGVDPCDRNSGALNVSPGTYRAAADISSVESGRLRKSAAASMAHGWARRRYIWGGKTIS